MIRRLRSLTRPAPSARWRIVHTPGSALSEADLRAMWRFRLGIFELKPRCDPEADFRAFATYCTKSQIATRVMNPAGDLEGTVVTYWQERADDGAPYVVIMPEFMFLSREARRRSVLPRMFAGIVARSVRAFAGRPTYLAGFGYPSGFATLERLVGRFALEGEPVDDPRLARVFDALIELAGERWCPTRRAKDMPTLPVGLTERWLSHQSTTPVFQRYVRRCPDWAQGYTPPIAGRVTSLGVLSRCTKHLVRRAGR